MLSFKSTLLLQKNKFVWLICAVIGILTLQIPAIFVGPDLDASGLVALAWIRVNDFQIGQDVVWQFGPLGYLFVQSYVEPSLWFQALLENVFVHFFFVFSVGLLIVKLRVNWKDSLLVLFLLFPLSFLISQSANIDEQLPFAVTISLFLIITGKINNKYVTPLLFSLALLLAIESLIKVNIAFVSVSIVVIFSLISIARKEFKRPLIFSASFIFCLLILWIISEQDIANFPSYFIDGLMVSSGYSYAMAIDGPMIHVFSALIAISFLTILFIYSLTKKFNNLTIFILLNIILLFMGFKHGFVRHDGHVVYFYFTWGIFFISTYIIYKYDIPQAVRDNKRLVFLTILIMGSVLLVVTMDVVSPKLLFWPNASENLPPWGEVFPLIFDTSYQTQRLEEHKQFLKGHLPLDEKTINHIGNKTMDIFPYDIMIPWVYDFNWSPIRNNYVFITFLYRNLGWYSYKFCLKILFIM